MEEVSRAWGWALFFGILTLVLGILVMVWPSETLKVLTILFALQLFVMGIYSLVKSFSAANQHKVWTVFLGIFSIILLLVGTEGNVGVHLRLLSRISRMVGSEQFRSALLSARTVEEVSALLGSNEEEKA